jgi:hypothetical protein
LTFDFGDGPVEITEHNRSPLAVSIERIETTHRMANGSLRKYHIADKNSFEVSWEMLPTGNTHTVDGRSGASILWSYYVNHEEEFVMTVANRDGSTTSFTVHFTDGTKSVEKRWEYEYWNISLSMEQI